MAGCQPSRDEGGLVVRIEGFAGGKEEEVLTWEAVTM